MHRTSDTSTSSTIQSAEAPELPATDGGARTGDVDGDERLTMAEEAVWSDPERLARIEAVLDDPSLTVPLEELE